MTVKELKQALSKCDDDSEIIIQTMKNGLEYSILEVCPTFYQRDDETYVACIYTDKLSNIFYNTNKI